MFFQIRQHITDGVVNQHIAVGVIRFVYLQDAHFAAAFFHVFAENFQSLDGVFVLQKCLAQFAQRLIVVIFETLALFLNSCFGGPDFQQFTSGNHFFHAVGSVGVEFDMLMFAFAFVATLVFP